MNTNMKELNFNELEKVNGGVVLTATASGVAIAACVVGVAAAVVKVGSFIYDCVMDH